MKVGVISDTHIPTTAKQLPPAIFDIFKDVELIIHAGDIVELSVLEELGRLAPVEAVAGTVDTQEVKQSLPAKKVIQIGKFRTGLIHGHYHLSVQQERILGEFENVDLIIYGHSHHPFWGQINGIYMLNPGTPTDYIHTSFNSVAILEAGEELKAEIIEIKHT